MKAKERYQLLIDKLVEGIMHPTEGCNNYMEDWDWYQGVALFGLYHLYRDMKKQEILDYLLSWFRDHMKEGLPKKNINTMCPMLTLTYLYEETGDEAFWMLCNEWLDYALQELPRTKEGGFQHITRDSDNTGQLWCDTLYMTVLFVARMGVLLKDDDIVQESIRQFLVHIKYLTNQATGLFCHGWTFEENNHFGGALWGRGNAWYTAGLVDYMEITDIPKGVREFLLTTLLRQAEAFEKYQDADGMWHTLLNQPESSYAEASATAGISYGLLKAARQGWIEPRYGYVAMKGVNAIEACIDEDGILQRVSAGTCVGNTLDYYREIPISPQPYGQSMALLLLTEAARGDNKFLEEA